MAKRYYLCDIIGDGSEDEPYRPKVADYGVKWSGGIEVGPDGKPLHSDILVIVSTNNHSVLRGVPGIDPLPDFALDGKMSAINNVVKKQMINALRRRGIDDSGIGNTDGYREAMQQIGKQRSATFDIDKLDVREDA